MSRVFRRDRNQCQACGRSARPVLAIHHVIPVWLGGTDSMANLLTLCANCHRSVHWLSAGDRSVNAHGYGLGESVAITRKLLKLARRIRRRRLREMGQDLVLKTSVSLETAFAAVARRNGLSLSERRFFERCVRKALRAIRPPDLRQCSVRLPRGERFISINANNYLALRAPAWSDLGYRLDCDILLIWPYKIPPTSMSLSKSRRVRSGKFKLIPYGNLLLTWDECLALSSRDWHIFRNACNQALTLVRTRRWPSNVVV
jgi:HNH endonuclease